jgi:ribosomal protein S18 acetylase RimI-like enzyme
MRIRSYRDEDREPVVALWRTVFPDAPARNDPVLDIERKRRVQPELFLVAVADGELVGTAMAGFDGHRGWLHLVAVVPHMRRRGVGAALIARAEELLAERGCPKLNLQVRASTPEAVGFYLRLGYRVEDRISLGKLLPPGRAPAV